MFIAAAIDVATLRIRIWSPVHIVHVLEDPLPLLRTFANLKLAVERVYLAV